MEYHEQLPVSRSAFEDLREHFEKRSFRGREYWHLPDYRRDLHRGVVRIGDTVVDGFPKVPRTLVLEAGIPRHFEGAVAVEEKLNGSNVRIALVDDDPAEPLAVTRSGIICPFTTYMARHRLPVEAFFADNPELMLCAEMVGPHNPYTAYEYAEVDSLSFRVFDVRERESGEPLAVQERRDRCEEYDLPQVPFYGVYDPDEAVPAVRAVIEDLDERGREGVVMKSPDVSRQLKYTTSAANQGDLAYAFSLPFDYGQSFMFQRLVREGFQAVEFGADEGDRRERARELGEAILLPMIDAIETVEAGGTVGERHTVRAPPVVVDELFEHFEAMGLTIRIEDDHTDDGERVTTFLKETQATRDKIRTYLDGQVVRE